MKPAIFLTAMVLMIILVSCAGESGDAVEALPMFRGNLAHTGEYTSGPQELAEPLWQFETSGAIESSTTVADGVVYFGSRDGHLYAVDATTGQQQWSFEAKADIVATPAIANDLVYFGSEDLYMYAVAVEDGAEAWRFKTGGFIWSSPAVADDLVYFGSRDSIF